MRNGLCSLFPGRDVRGLPDKAPGSSSSRPWGLLSWAEISPSRGLARHPGSHRRCLSPPQECCSSATPDCELLHSDGLPPQRPEEKGRSGGLQEGPRRPGTQGVFLWAFPTCVTQGWSFSSFWAVPPASLLSRLPLKVSSTAR